MEFHQYDYHRLLLDTLQMNIHWQVIIRRCVLSLSNWQHCDIKKKIFLIPPHSLNKILDIDISNALN